MQWNLQSSLTCLQPKKHHSSLFQLASSRDTRRKSFGLTFYSLEITTHTPLISRFVFTSTRRFYRLDQNKPEPSICISLLVLAANRAAAATMSFGGQTPTIIVLKEGTDASQGKGQMISNIQACLAVQDTIRSTLGPYGGDLLLVDENGRQTITNDGATVMKVRSLLKSF